MFIYIEKVEIWSGVTDPSQTHTQTTEYISAILSFSKVSIKFKLSHAIKILEIENSQITVPIIFLKV